MICGTRRASQAFTLIELLVVIAIIGLLMSLLLPALGQARRVAQVAKSLANLHSNSSLINVYASDNKDSFVNPFDRVTPCGGPPFYSNLDWVWVPTQFCQNGYPYGEGFASSSGTETFGYYWGAHMLYADDEGLSRLNTLISPGDRALNLWFQNNAPAQTDWLVVFPTSYWYPPVFWQSPARFDPASRMTSNSGNHYWISRNRFSQTVFPNGKVLLFENKDYYNHRDDLMWNEPLAHDNVALVDGSAISIRMSDVIAKTATNGGQQQDRIEAPSGLWNPGNSEMNRFLYGINEGFDWSNFSPAHPGFFWATRHGIRGVDLP